MRVLNLRYKRMNDELVFFFEGVYNPRKRIIDVNAQLPLNCFYKVERVNVNVSVVRYDRPDLGIHYEKSADVWCNEEINRYIRFWMGEDECLPNKYPITNPRNLELQLFNYKIPESFRNENITNIVLTCVIDDEHIV